MAKYCTILLSIFILGLGFTSTSFSSVLFREDFNQTGLQPDWTIKHNNPAYYSLSGGYLNLRANSGDIYNTRTDYQNLFLVSNPTSGDFKVTLRVNRATMAQVNYAQLALFIHDSDDNYLRLYYCNSANGTFYFALGKEVNGSWTAQTRNIYFGTNPFYLQFEKQGNIYTASYSTNGVNFATPLSSVSFGDSTPLRVGFMSMVDSTQSSRSYLDYFEISDDSVPPVPVPEPASMLLIGLGVVGLIGKKIRK